MHRSGKLCLCRSLVLGASFAKALLQVQIIERPFPVPVPVSLPLPGPPMGSPPLFGGFAGFAGFAAGAGTKDGFHSPALALSFEGGFAGAAAFAGAAGFAADEEVCMPMPSMDSSDDEPSSAPTKPPPVDTMKDHPPQVSSPGT